MYFCKLNLHITSNLLYMTRHQTILIIKYATAFSLLVSIVSCGNKSNETEYTPWGTPVENVAGEDTATHTGMLTLEEIVAQGELIMLTMSGPETYYDYHGHGMGLQFLLCEKFAESIGVKVRVELCTDTLQLKRRLEKGEGDIIAYNVTDSCGVKCGPGWTVAKENTTLAEKIKKWYKPAFIDETKKYQARLLENGGVIRHVYAPVLNREKGVISRWDGLFRKYAPHARLDWKLLAAQCYQESCFDPKAHSWAGACGLMQIMPSTAKQLGLPIERIYEPEQNIAAAARYMNQLMREFAYIPSQYDRLCFALASYNGGKLHVNDAMALAKKDGRNSNQWNIVGEYILKLAEPKYYTDPVVKYGYMRGSETFNYVNSIIRRWKDYGGRVPATARLGIYNGPATQPVIIDDRSPRPAKKKHKYQI